MSVDQERQLTAILHAAGEYLRAGDVIAAEEEVNQALALRPDDVRVLNLLGLVRFRAGRHEAALTLYQDLVERQPSDASLRLNLGLVELRMGRNTEAAAHLQQVVDQEPDNIRAFGYLGLALMRSGQLLEAREALLRAGQEELVREVDAQLAPAAGAAVEDQVAASADLTAIGETVPGGDAPVVPAAGGAEIGEEAIAGPLLKLHAPQSIASFAAARLLRGGEPGHSFALADGGLLVIRVNGRLPTRNVGAIVSAGQLHFEPLKRRIRGRITDEPIGNGLDAMYLTTGHGLIVVAPRGQRFTALTLDQDVVYVRESALFAFDESLAWESGRIPGSGPEGEPTLQLRGRGQCVIRSHRPTFCLQVAPGDSLFVGEEVLLGWVGRVQPRQLKGSDDEPTPYVEATGEGTLILEEPAA